jgi:hypothetical protein
VVCLEYVQAQHPPDKKKRDCRNYDVANPLSGGLRLGAIGHGQRITLGLKASSVRRKRNLLNGTMRVTLKTVNDRLAELGYNARLEKGDGYFYFSGGEAADWLDCTVKVATLSSLTLDQWVDEFKRLKRLNEDMRRPPVKKKRR